MLTECFYLLSVAYKYMENTVNRFKLNEQCLISLFLSQRYQMFLETLNICVKLCSNASLDAEIFRSDLWQNAGERALHSFPARFLLLPYKTYKSFALFFPDITESVSTVMLSC